MVSRTKAKSNLARRSDGDNVDVSMKAVESPAQPMSGVPLWPLSVDAYHALGEAGLIPKNTELLYGFVYRKMSKSPYHSYLVQILHDLVVHACGGNFLVRTEQPITCLDSEPEPDVAIVKGSNENFRHEHPRTAELVIEVCISSHDYDRSKLRAYASAGVKECWLILGPEKQIEVHRQPSGESFSECVVHGPGGKLLCAAIPEFSVDLDAFFAK